MSGTGSQLLKITGEATAEIDVTADGSPIQVIATDAIRSSLEPSCIQQAIQARLAPGVSRVVLNPDAHVGYGAPVGCVMVSPTHIYPGPVGVDIKCSMSLLQTELPAEEIESRPTRRALINAILERIPTGPGRGQRHVKKGRSITEDLTKEVLIHGASPNVLKQLGIPIAWADRCEDAFHRGPEGGIQSLANRLDWLLRSSQVGQLLEKGNQLGSYGGGNHFGECEIVRIANDDFARSIANSFGLMDGRIAFLSHCGSRGIGHNLATNQFRTLADHFTQTGIAFPFGDRHLVHAEDGSREGWNYLCDMALGANFATVNHLLINALVLEAFLQVFPGVRGTLVYFISHNIAKREQVDGRKQWVHRKGATRAFPAGHPELERTPFAGTGHPILLPGNPRDGSSVMVALDGAERSCFSVNHGAGRSMSRTAAKRSLNQSSIDQELDRKDILSNCRQYPIDEAPAAYKDFNEVLRSVELAGLAREVARLAATFVIKDGSPADD